MINRINIHQVKMHLQGSNIYFTPYNKNDYSNLTTVNNSIVAGIDEITQYKSQK